MSSRFSSALITFNSQSLTAKQKEDDRFHLIVDLAANLVVVHKVGKRALHSFEHSARLFLGAMKGVTDAAFRRGEDAALLFNVALRLNVLHGCTGEKPFGAGDGAVARADVNRADGLAGVTSQRDNPHRLAAFVRAQRITDRCKLRA